ncbi:NAD(P)/FAD-dependent oxidoreductase [Nocardioides marmorisolisilvae]|nr:FAD-dependent oxidoreductase [Nocardioides marmorisolisilvae]
MSFTPRTKTNRVVVIGAGYAGMMATNRFLGSLTEEERSRTVVTVVNPKPVFVERIRLHEVAAGSRNAVTIPLAWLLHADAEVVVGRAELIDTVAREVLVVSDDEDLRLPYDYLLYAVGSFASTAIEGAAEHAYVIADHDGASAAAEAVRALPPRARVSIVGGGLTGVEIASELAEQHPELSVTLYCAGELVAQMRPAARRSLRRTLERLGVRIDEHAEVSTVVPGGLRLSGDRALDHELCIVAAAFDVPDLARASGLPVDEAGRLEVDEYLRCIDNPAILGAGDAVVAPQSVAGHLRMGCATALPMGAHAAHTLLAAIRGAVPRELTIGYVLQCISLGRKRGYIQLVRSDDTARRFHLGGRTGARVKEWICEMVVDSPKKESTQPGAYSWPKGPKRRAVTGAGSQSGGRAPVGARFGPEQHASYPVLSDRSRAS